MHYLLRYLARRQLDQAFPLVHLAEPELGLERWRAFAGGLVAAESDGMVSGAAPPPERGIVTAQDPASYIHGLFCYRLRQDLLADRSLEVSHFCVCSLVDPSGVAEALLNGIDILAGRLDCPQVCVELSEGASAVMNCRRLLIERFETFGHRADGVRFRRQSAPPRPAPA